MRAVVLVLSLTALLASCRPPDAGSSTTGSASADPVAVAIDLPEAPAVGPATVVVRVDRDGVAVEGADVEITGDMTHAGMVPVIRAAFEASPGVYRADDMVFDMAGDWIVTADVTLPDGSTTRQEAATTVRRP
ncbi:MAG: FixH family protein [Trueperaceae bacterium]|nr:FixH family protein [Trueperaceae bacterium]